MRRARVDGRKWEFFRVITSDGTLLVPCGLREFCEGYARTWNATGRDVEATAYCRPIEAEVSEMLMREPVLA